MVKSNLENARYEVFTSSMYVSQEERIVKFISKELERPNKPMKTKHTNL